MTKLLPQISSLLQQKAAQCLSVDTGRIAGAGCGHSCGGYRRLAEHKTAGNHTDGRAGHCVGGNGTSRHQKIGDSARDKAAVRNTKKRTVFQRIVGAAGIVFIVGIHIGRHDGDGIIRYTAGPHVVNGEPV